VPRRGKPLGRVGSTRPEQRRFLIYCEGEQTEDQYFKGLRNELRALPVTVCIGGAHGEPRSLVKAAVAHKERAPRSAADRYTAYDEVWCVVDVEAPRPHPSLDDALVLARRGGVRGAVTNPCFELWLLLHLRDVTAHQTSEAAQAALEREAGCGYTAKRKHLDYDALVGPGAVRHADARKRAVALRARNADGRRANPWTNVDELVEILRTARVR
jgi:hypothetical protein